MKKGILKRDGKHYMLAASVASMVLFGAGMLTLLGGVVSMGVYNSKYSDRYDELFAKNNEIAYQMQEEELKSLSSAYKFGELEFPEYSEKLEEVMSEKYLNDKTNQLMEKDEEYQIANAEIERAGDNAKKTSIAGGAIAAAGLGLAYACAFKEDSEKAKEEAKKEAEAEVE